jgi:DNA-binding NarL/FixJ family response regulator
MASTPRRPGILVIDADEPMRALVLEWLAGAGYRARGAPAPMPQADVGLVVLDLCDLPARGLAAVRRAKALFPAAAVLGLSTRVSGPLPAAARDALVPGLAALLPKPCTRAGLLAAVALALDAAGGTPAAAPAPAPAAP